MELNRSREDYLKTILILEQEKGTVRSAEVAQRLNVTRASVSYAVRKMKEDGFLDMDEHHKPTHIFHYKTFPYTLFSKFPD